MRFSGGFGWRTGLTVKGLGILARGYGYRHPVYHNLVCPCARGYKMSEGYSTLLYMYLSTKRHDTLHSVTRS